jgi:hypothetical protein
VTTPDGLGLGPGALALLADDVAVQDLAEPRYHDVLWWHYCADVDRWVPAGLGAHRVFGGVAAGDLTVEPSVLCRDCGRHGFVTDMAWRDA